MSDKIDTFTNKHANAQLPAFGQKEIQGLVGKDDFKVVISDKVVTSQKVPSNTQGRFVMHTYNDEKKIFC